VSWQATRWVWEHSISEGTARLVLLAIAWHANEDGEDAFPAQETISEKCRISVRTVRRAIDELGDIGELQVLEYDGPPTGKGGRRTHRYRLPMLSANLSDNSCEVGGQTEQVVGQLEQVVGQIDEVVGQLCPGKSPLESPSESSQNAFRDLIAVRLADNIASVDYGEWLDYVERLRGEGIGDTVIDEAAGQTINGVASGHVPSPRGYFMTVARDWYSQRVGVAP
jgi:hypothetical protein